MSDEMSFVRNSMETSSKVVDAGATGNHLTLKTAAMMNRKGTTASPNYRIPAMNASFFSETDNEDSEIDEVEEQLLRAFLHERAKIARSTSGDIDCEATTVTATESCSSDDIMDEDKATETAGRDLERQPNSYKNKAGKRRSKLSSSKEASEKTRCSKSTVSKETPESRNSTRHSRTSPCTKETRKNEENDETSIKRNSSKSRSSLKKGSSNRRRSSVESEAISSNRSGKTEDVDYDDDISGSSFYQEALELDEGGEDEKLQKLASPSRQGIVRRRDVSARRRSSIAKMETSGMPRRNLSKKSSSDGGLNDEATAVTMETKATNTPELARVTRNSRRRSSIATAKASEMLKKNLQSALSNCDDMSKTGEREKSSRRERTNVSPSKNETMASRPIQLSAADALCDAEGDQKNALARILRNAKDIRTANTPLDGQSDSEDEQEDGELFSVRQALARSAIAATPGRARRRGSVGTLSRC